MKIIVEREALETLHEGIKALPIKCENFDHADNWVSTVLYLENILLRAEQYTEENETRE